MLVHDPQGREHNPGAVLNPQVFRGVLEVVEVLVRVVASLLDDENVLPQRGNTGPRGRIHRTQVPNEREQPVWKVEGTKVSGHGTSRRTIKFYTSMRGLQTMRGGVSCETPPLR